MLRTTAIALVAASTLALPALADPPAAHCHLLAVRVADATTVYTGILAGEVVHAEGGPVSIRCDVYVNGVPRATTPTGHGTGAATTAGPVAVAATDGDSVAVCAYATTTHGVTETCETALLLDAPPELVRDLLIQLYSVWTPPLCDYLRAAPGSYGVVVVDSDGDLWVGGDRYWDCPPYADAGPDAGWPAGVLVAP